MKTMAGDPERYLATAAEILAAEGRTDAAEILRKSTPRVDKTGYDNWNGGTTIWTIFLLLDPAAYALISGKRESLQKQIKERLEPILSQFTDDWFSVTIAPKVDPLPEWRHAAGDVSSATRQNIVDGMKIDRVHWAGRLEDVEFLQRLYDLESMPSSDRRFENAAGDIWQHRVNNPGDWPDDWIYDDDRFNLLQARRTHFSASCARWSTPLCVRNERKRWV